MQDKWLSAIKDKFGNCIEKEFQKKYSYVCDLHFPEECFYFAGSTTQRLLLQRRSFPSIFINFRSRASQYVTEKYDLIYKRLQLPDNDEGCSFESDNSPIKIEPSNSAAIVTEFSVIEPKIENSSSQDNDSMEAPSISCIKSEPVDNYIKNEFTIENSSGISTNESRDECTINISTPLRIKKDLFPDRSIPDAVPNSSKANNSDCITSTLINSLKPNNFSHILNKKFLADVNESEIDFKNEVLNKKLFRKYKAESASYQKKLMKCRKEMKNLRMQVSRYKRKVIALSIPTG
ncbi:uncharacterized protein LOC117178845 isoform X2 [Belonocnema kinseyi]|nr:uncharacterized protein LOC117178845 isoform X2 [Belonocnema kinseyi]